MTATHTPGPWYWGKGKDVAVCKDIGDRCYDIAVVADWTQETDANARLIAAAPELIVALDGLLANHIQLVESGDCGNWNVETEHAVIIARAAIAKARGA